MLLQKLENCKIDVRRCKIEYMLLDRKRECQNCKIGAAKVWTYYCY